MSLSERHSLEAQYYASTVSIGLYLDVCMKRRNDSADNVVECADVCAPRGCKELHSQHGFYERGDIGRQRRVVNRVLRRWRHWFCDQRCRNSGVNKVRVSARLINESLDAALGTRSTCNANKAYDVLFAGNADFYWTSTGRFRYGENSYFDASGT